ncbi:unnamed protein product, partial [Ixodes hexagonus]
LAVAAAVVAVALLFTLMIHFFGLSTAYSKEKLAHCQTTACFEHKIRLTENLDRRLDPCQDFETYVCSAWAVSPKNTEFVTSSLSELVISWFASVQTILRDDTKQFDVDAKVVAMFNACMSEMTITVDKLAFLRGFMRDRKLSWPEKIQMPVDALEVLIDLDVNWQLPLWFKLRLVRARGWTPHRIIVYPGPNMVYWKNLNKHVSMHQKDYFTAFYNRFTITDAEPRDDLIRHDIRAQQRIFDMIFNASTSNSRKAERVFLGELERYTPSISSKRWILALNKAYSVIPPFNTKDEVLITNTDTLATVQALFTELGEEVIIRHTSWWFLQNYAPLAGTHMLEIMLGNKHEADVQKPFFCVSVVEYCFAALLNPLYTRRLFSEPERANIDNFLGSIVQGAVNMVSSSKWLDEDSKQSTTKKLQDLRVALWPPEVAMTYKGFEIHAAPSSKPKTFAQLWVAALKNMQRLKNSDGYESLTQMHANSYQPYFEYTDFLNRVDISLGALSKPMYYREGTTAMMYGSLGTFFANQLVKAFDRTGIALTPNQGGSLLFSNKSLEIFEDKINCLGSSSQNIFPEIPALEITFNAYHEALKGNNATVRTIEGFSEEQVFFMTACLMSCRLPGMGNYFGADCNKGVMNFPEFSAAFNCSLGSRMNPHKKCTFF